MHDTNVFLRIKRTSTHPVDCCPLVVKKQNHNLLLLLLLLLVIVVVAELIKSDPEDQKINTSIRQIKGAFNAYS